MTPYLANVALCGVALVALAFVPETRRAVATDREAAVSRDAVPQLDAAERRSFAVAAATSGIVWWLASLFVSIVPAFVSTLLDAHSPALQGALALIVFVVSPLAQTLGRRLSDGTASRAGLLGTVLAARSAAGRGARALLALFAVGAVIAGVAHGLGFLGAQSAVNRIGAPAMRARLSARFYAVTYSCIGITLLGIGALTAPLGLYGALAVVAAAAALVAVLLTRVTAR